MECKGDYFNFDRRTHKRFYFVESAGKSVTKFRIVSNYVFLELSKLRWKD